MSSIRGFSHVEVWTRALTQALGSDSVTSPRGMPTLELPWMQLETYDPLTIPLVPRGREMRDVIGVLEGLSLVGEFNVPELFTDRVSKFAQFMDDGVLWGAYGQRAHGSMGDVVDLLKRDPDSRQAVVTFYDSKRDLNRAKGDIPCTISAQFLLRNGRLDLGISMRSNDLWLGTPYDFVQFTILQASVAQALGVSMGRYVHRVGSLHLYSRNIDAAKGVGFKSAVPMPFPFWGSGPSVGHIQSRARMLSLGQLKPATEFEEWCRGLLTE